MKKVKFHALFIFVTLFLIAFQSRAQTSTEDIFKSLDYPELQVVPRASERLQAEAQYEGQRGYLVHWPIVLPSLATLYLGLTASGDYESGATSDEKDDADLYSTTATMIGGFWVAATGFLTWSKPYRAGHNQVRKYKEGDKRSELYRERTAEEALESQAETMRTLVRLSIISNFLAVAAVASSHDVSDGEVAIAGLLAFTPLIFEHRHISTWDKQLEYKRKIYSPIASLGMKYDATTKNYNPQAILAWAF